LADYLLLQLYVHFYHAKAGPFCEVYGVVTDVQQIQRGNQRRVPGARKHESSIHIMPSCFQKLKYKFLKAYLVLCLVNQLFNI